MNSVTTNTYKVRERQNCGGLTCKVLLLRYFIFEFSSRTFGSSRNLSFNHFYTRKLLRSRTLKHRLMFVQRDMGMWLNLSKVYHGLDMILLFYDVEEFIHQSVSPL